MQGVLTTAQAASTVPAGSIALTLTLYVLLYLLLLTAYVSVLFHLAGKAAGNKAPAAPGPAATPTRTGVAHA